MKIFNIFKVFDTYREWKQKRIIYGDAHCKVVIKGLELESISSDTGVPPTPEQIRIVCNIAIADMTKQVKSEYGF